MGWLEFQYEREAKRQENKREGTDHDVPSGWREPTIWLRSLLVWGILALIVLTGAAFVMNNVNPIQVASLLPWAVGAWIIAYALE